jgi:phosphoribosylformimino-5-aminoimidazole carboxamide ribotide isomerase
MQVIPVLDLKAGQAVHAVRGERERYAPVQGILGSGDDPLALAAAYRDRLDCHTCYVADLDAIAGKTGHPELLSDLAALGLTLWVDAGVSSAGQAQALVRLGVTRVIVGSETLRSTDQLGELATALPPDRLVLSVDLQGGVLRAPPGTETPRQLVALAARAGIRAMILLDLARVGVAAGPPLDMLVALRPSFPDLAFYAGGGVRHRDDLEALAQAGAAGALVATAFHRGALTAADVQAYRS